MKRGTIPMASWCAGTAAVVAFISYSRWPYSYYEIFRWLICLSACCAAYSLRTRPAAIAASVAVAVVFNPIIPLRMRAYEWERWDIAAGIAMGCVAFYAWKMVDEMKPKA